MLKIVVAVFLVMCILPYIQGQDKGQDSEILKKLVPQNEENHPTNIQGQITVTLKDVPKNETTKAGSLKACSSTYYCYCYASGCNVICCCYNNCYKYCGYAK